VAEPGPANGPPRPSDLVSPAGSEPDAPPSETRAEPSKSASPPPTDRARREWYEHPNVKKVLEKFNGDIKSVTPRKTS